MSTGDDRWDRQADRAAWFAHNALDRPARTAGKVGWTFTKIALIFMVVMIPLGIIGFAFDWFGGVADEVFDPKKNVYDHEQFHRDIERAEQYKSNYQINADSLAALKKEQESRKLARDEREELRIYRSAMIGNKTQHNELAAKYNARADMVTRSWLRNGRLPKRIEMIQ